VDDQSVERRWLQHQHQTNRSIPDRGAAAKRVRSEHGKDLPFASFPRERGPSARKPSPPEGGHAKRKITALGSALGSIVHDLRNPVRAIQSLCELIHQAIAAGITSEVEEFVELVRQSGDDAMDIVNSVLDFTRKTVIERSPVLLTDFCSQLREKSRHLLEGGCTIMELNVDVPAGTGVWIDAKKLQRAANLFKNACEVLPSKDVKASWITVTMAEREGELQIVVTDNGPRIAPEIQIRLFEPFVTYGKSDGIGLGLASVRQIIESHDGIFTVESTPAGASFKMRLPQPQTAEAVLPG
jgi:two-component system NtrC family sensor kinase